MPECGFIVADYLEPSCSRMPGVRRDLRCDLPEAHDGHHRDATDAGIFGPVNGHPLDEAQHVDYDQVHGVGEPCLRCKPIAESGDSRG